MARPRQWCLRALLCLAVVLATVERCRCEGERKFRRMDARNWASEARKQAASAAKTFLEEAGQVRARTDEGERAVAIRVAAGRRDPPRTGGSAGAVACGWRAALSVGAPRATTAAAAPPPKAEPMAGPLCNV